MLKYIAETVSNNYLNLGNPINVCLNKSLDAPSDDLDITFPTPKKMDEIKNITVYDEDNKEIFFGPVDVQKFSLKTNGSYLSLAVRNKVAFLLDNEALPQSYALPSLEVIFKRHVKPYGFNSFKGDDRSFSEEFVISKGMSEWEVIKTFCVNYLGVYPRFLNNEVLDATNKITVNKVTFSNESKGFIKYSSICENIKRYKQYSELYIKTAENPAYSLAIKNEEAVKKGIVRKRFLNVSQVTGTPIAYGEKILSTSNKNAFELVLSCPGNINLKTGGLANIKDSSLNLNEDFLIYKTQYILNKNEESTIVTLIKKEVIN